VFHGLQDSGDEAASGSSSKLYLFDTFVSCTLDHRMVDTTNEHTSLLLLNTSESIVWADVSWISKFPFEHEILFAPSNTSYLTNPKAIKTQQQFKDSKTELERGRGASLAYMSTQSGVCVLCLESCPCPFPIVLCVYPFPFQLSHACVLFAFGFVR